MPTTAAELLDRLASFPWDEWQKKLAPGFRQRYRDLVVKTGEAAAADAGGAWARTDPFTSQFMTSYVGERIVQLDETTKVDVSRLIRRVIAESESLTTTELGTLIQDTVKEKFEDFARWRADRIARTETAIAANHGDILGMKQAEVGHVKVLDGTDDAICRAANGAIWTIGQALDDPLGHPNCTRTFVKATDEEIAAAA